MGRAGISFAGRDAPRPVFLTLRRRSAGGPFLEGGNMKNTMTAGRSLLLVPLALLLAAGAALSAQEAKPDRRFGLMASYASPGTASLKIGGNSLDDFLSSGMGAAVTCEWAMGANGAIRARAEYLSFGGKDVKIVERTSYEEYTNNLNYGMTAMVLGADYIHAFQPGDQGIYVFGGLGYYITDGSGSNRWEIVDYYGRETGTESWEGSGNAIGISLGAGWRFSPNLSGELKYVTTNGLKHDIKMQEPGWSNQQSFDVDLTWIQASVCYRF
jgi:hypothetical protein